MLSKKSWSYNPWIGDPKVMNCKSLSMMVCYSLGNQDFQECCVTCTVVHEIVGFLKPPVKFENVNFSTNKIHS